MSRKTRKVKKDKLVSITCDKCGLFLNIEQGGFHSSMEHDEMLHWENSSPCTSSIFTEHVSIDLCQRCVNELLGGYIQPTGGTK